VPVAHESAAVGVEDLVAEPEHRPGDREGSGGPER
jgi:hypothetical protein